MRFREFLKSVTFRNVLRTTDSEFLNLLHQNYRIQYLKDTALARCMDESCVGFLTTYQLSLANETIAYFIRAADLKKSLVERLKEMDVEGFELLGEMNGMVKAVAAYTRIEFYEFLYSEGIVAFTTHALSHQFPPSDSPRIRVLLSDLIVSLLTSLPARAKDLFTLEEQKEETAELVKAVADALLSAKEISAVMQLAELMHVVIDPPGDKRESELSDYFFDSIFPSLVAPLSLQSAPDEETRTLLCELLSLLTHCVQAQYSKVRFLLLSSDVLATVFKLLDLSDKPLAIAAIKLLRTVMEKNDPVTIKHVITHNLLQKVWSLLQANGPRETMVFSSVLSFIDALESCDNPQLTDHIVVKHLPQFHNSPLYALFDKIVMKHQPRTDTYALWNPREISAKEDEAYFEGDSDEDSSTLKRKREDSNSEFEKKAKLEAAED